MGSARKHFLQSPFVDSSIDNEVLQTNWDFTSHFLNLSTIPECYAYLIDVLLHNSQTL